MRPAYPRSGSGQLRFPCVTALSNRRRGTRVAVWLRAAVGLLDRIGRPLSLALAARSAAQLEPDQSDVHQLYRMPRCRSLRLLLHRLQLSAQLLLHIVGLLPLLFQQLGDPLHLTLVAALPLMPAAAAARIYAVVCCRCTHALEFDSVFACRSGWSDARDELHSASSSTAMSKSTG